MASKSPGRRSKEFTIEFDQIKINKLFADLQSQIGAKSLKGIVRGEAAAVLLRAAKLTRSAKKRLLLDDLAKFRARYSIMGARSSKQSKRMSEWQDKRLAKIKEKIARIGSSRDAWLSIIRKLNLKPANANQSKGLLRVMGNARPKVNGQYINHRATGGREASTRRGTYSIEVYNSNPVGRWARAPQALKSALRGRAKFFKANLKTGVFKSAKSISAKYPGIEVNKI